MHVHGLQRAVERVQLVLHVAGPLPALKVDRINHTRVPLVHEVGVEVLLHLDVV